MGDLQRCGLLHSLLLDKGRGTAAGGGGIDTTQGFRLGFDPPVSCADSPLFSKGGHEMAANNAIPAQKTGPAGRGGFSFSRCYRTA